jgi:hypothetical protein
MGAPITSSCVNVKSFYGTVFDVHIETSYCCNIDQYVVNLQFELGVENSVTEMEHVTSPDLSRTCSIITVLSSTPR